MFCQLVGLLSSIKSIIFEDISFSFKLVYVVYSLVSQTEYGNENKITFGE